MPERLHGRRLWLVVVLVAAATVAVAADQGAATRKRPLTYDAYDGWRSIQGTRLSRDGVWLAYALVPQEGDGELVVKNLKTNAELRQPRGSAPVITRDSRFVVYTVAPVKAEVDKAKKEKKKPEEQPKPALGVLDLRTGQATVVERVKNWKVADEGSRHVAVLLEAPLAKPEEKKVEERPAEKKPEPDAAAATKKEKKKDPGTELLVRELGTGAETRIAEVVEYAWNKDGTWLAYAVSSKTPADDGAFARQPGEAESVALLEGNGHYKGFAFDDKGAQLAFVSDRDDYAADAPSFKLYHWRAGTAVATEIVSTKTAGMPKGATVSEHGTLEFSKDGERLFLGTAPLPKAEPEDAADLIKVDIWHWKDPYLQPMQRVRAEGDKKRSFRAVVHLKDKRFVQLAAEDVPTVALSEDMTRGAALSDVPYRQLVSWDSSHQDLYAIDLQDGSRRRLVEKLRFAPSLSPGGAYSLYFDAENSHWCTVRMSDGQVANLTAKLDVRFDNESSDTPEPPRPYGTAGWTDGDRSVLLYDKYDIWEVAPDGTSARMVTNGAGRRQHLVFRYQRLDPEERTVKGDRPLLLATTNDVTKASGYYRVPLDGTDDPVRIVLLDRLFGGLLKAKDADVLAFTTQRFEEFPNLWVGDGNFANMRKVSDANPQQADFVWGRSELIDYVNTDGRALRAILTKPEDFDPSKKYPMMVYIYEQLTGGLHRYVAPSPGTSINIARYVSNGYIVLQPDIVYDTGYPGESALKCVLPAVQKVLGMGFVDPKRVGIQGHSWGGYQITYLITRTDIFRAVQAGASVTNMVSAYGGIRWGTGMSRAFQYERTQSRIGAPPWKATLQFIENSPIFWVEKVTTPYLTIHNDEDDAVPWYQGIEFFSALRRLGKEAYMFVYNGEKHGLRERENQKHWTVHQDEFFDHYLLGARRPEWMDKGVPYLERGTRDVKKLFRGIGTGGR